MKRIVERMPSDRAGVFAYPIDWAAYDALPAALQGKISTWVGKTIKEMLGEEEQTLVNPATPLSPPPFFRITRGLKAVLCLMFCFVCAHVLFIAPR